MSEVTIKLPRVLAEFVSDDYKKKIDDCLDRGLKEEALALYLTIQTAFREALEEADLPVSFGSEELNKKLDEAVEDVKNGKVVVVEPGKLNEFLEGL